MTTFQQQVDRLVEVGYHDLAAEDARTFRTRLEPLRDRADGLANDDPDGTAPFVVVVTRDLVDPYAAVPLLHLAGRTAPGVVDRNHAPGDLATYDPTPDAQPPGTAYLLLDVERGEEFCGVRPEEAVATIRSRGRSPLTIDEGIALVLQRPDLLVRNRCFMLAGSRRSAIEGDRRVPALWIHGARVADKAPKLGWCWDGNPHSWLGVASAGSRAVA